MKPTPAPGNRVQERLTASHRNKLILYRAAGWETREKHRLIALREFTYKLREECCLSSCKPMRTVKTLPTLIVWYNTKCPVCNAGIDWQHNRLVRAARAGAMEFRDINMEPDALQHFGADVNDVRRRLHAVDSDGRLYVGADCAIAVWLRTPGDAWLGRLLDAPGLRHIARAGYDLFADLLFAWNRWKGHW